jgi:hypothetical protein
MNKIAFLLCLTIITGCKKENNAIPALKQEVLFQIDYINYAWGYDHHGLLIDSSGNVRTYRLPNNWHFEDADGTISASDMHENLQQIDTVSFKIDKDSLIANFRKLPYAAMGAITEPKMVMVDAGSTQYSGYIYNANLKQYKQILLKQEGDVLIENKSSEANEIYNWLVRLHKR